jgi:predicted nucleic acid-binding protein
MEGFAEMTSPVLPRYTLDASIAVKWFSLKREPYRGKALRLREDYHQLRLEILCPDILVYEVANVLRYKEGIRESAVLEAVRSLFLMEILFPVDPTIMSESIKLARRYDLSVYDAVYIGFARHRGCSFITADRAVCRKLGGAADVFALDQI